jgi:hypothetical protein
MQGSLYFQRRTQGLAGGMESGRKRIPNDPEHKSVVRFDRLAQDLVVPRQKSRHGIGILL